MVFVGITLLKRRMPRGSSEMRWGRGIWEASWHCRCTQTSGWQPTLWDGVDSARSQCWGGTVFAVSRGRKNPVYNWVPSSAFRQLGLSNLTLELHIGSPHNRSDNSQAKVTLESMTAKDGLVLFTRQNWDTRGREKEQICVEKCHRGCNLSPALCAFPRDWWPSENPCSLAAVIAAISS